MELVYKYEPKDDTELLDILNILEDRLNQSSPSVLMGSTKVFLKYTKKSPLLNRQVIDRLQAPLITIMTSSEISGGFESCYVVLSHINNLIDRSNFPLFSNEYKHFFCRFDEPPFVKNLKIEILSKIAIESNLQSILSELNEYITDINISFACKSVSSIATIALRLPSMSKQICQNLINSIKIQVPHITEQIVIEFGLILRKYPEIISEINPFLNQIFHNITKVDSLVSFSWILGQFSNEIEDSPYIIESLIEAFPYDSSLIPFYKSLLISSAKIFIKRPAESIRAIGRIFEIISDTNDDFDLKSRASLIYNLLQSDITKIGKYLEQHSSLNSSEYFQESQEDIPLDEFNTLSIVYHQPKEKFIEKELVQRIYQQEIKSEEITNKEEERRQREPPQKIEYTNILDIDDKETGKIYEAPNLFDIKFTEEIPSKVSIELIEGKDLSTDDFQKFWETFTEESEGNLNISHKKVTIEEIESLSSKRKLTVIATSEHDNSIKLFLYGFSQAEAWVLLELSIDFLAYNLKWKVKSKDKNYSIRVGELTKIAFESLTK